MKNRVTITTAIVALIFAGFAVANADVYKLNNEASKIDWTGSKVFGSHDGSIELNDGMLVFEGDKITGGEFVVDMTSITNRDIESPKTNAKLVGHLKSEDFFGVKKHPTAKFIIKKVNKKKDNLYSITGDMIIKGNSNEVTFDAKIWKSGEKIHAMANFDIDRTKWNIRYRSTNFFDSLGDVAISDDFNLRLDLFLYRKNVE